jgi:hypothetical protein
MSELRQRQPRRHLPSHLKFIRTLPCVVSLRGDGIQAAHVSYGCPLLGKRARGVGEKSCDIWVVPLHHELHLNGPDAQHTMNEQAFWRRHGIDPCIVSLVLFAHSGNYEICERIVRNARQLPNLLGEHHG